MCSFSDWHAGGKFVTSSPGGRSPSTHKFFQKYLREKSDWTKAVVTHAQRKMEQNTHSSGVLRASMWVKCSWRCSTKTFTSCSQRGRLCPSLHLQAICVTTAIDAAASIRPPSKTPPSVANNGRNTSRTMLSAYQTVHQALPVPLKFSLSDPASPLAEM